MGQIDHESGSKKLTQRQIECLGLVAKGFSSKEIARQLGLSSYTVDTYISAAVAALGVTNRRAAARSLGVPDAIPEKLEYESIGVARLNFDINSSSSEIQTNKDFANQSISDFENNEDIVIERSFHILRGSRVKNTLTIKQRLLWIVSFSVAMSVIFATSIVVIDTVSKLIKG